MYIHNITNACNYPHGILIRFFSTLILLHRHLHRHYVRLPMWTTSKCWLTYCALMDVQKLTPETWHSQHNVIHIPLHLSHRSIVHLQLLRNYCIHCWLINWGLPTQIVAWSEAVKKHECIRNTEPETLWKEWIRNGNKTRPTTYKNCPIFPSKSN